MRDEEWRLIAGHEGRYEVSSMGRVRNSATSKLMTQQSHSRGYASVRLRCARTRYCTYLIHRLVAITFVPKPKSRKRLCVNHLNSVKTDNRAANLEWVTYAQNSAHAVQAGVIPRGERNPQAKVSDAGASYIRRIYTPGIRRELAAEFGVSAYTIWDIGTGRSRGDQTE